ncbi:cellulose biosynthesis protein BcsN [Bauldia litoralis]|uniref:cellulose biosynthesis protein BcsN n=1 Tax=Bauldia litoralis TaxID=665467 RepID=UPI003265DE70
MLIVGLGLSGCVSGPRIASVKSELPAAESFVTLPPGGPATISILEKRYKDAIVRETILATDSRVPGQNFLTATIRGPVGYRTNRDNALGPDSITPSQIAKEFQWYLLGVPMMRSQLYAQNKYGSFGFALGTARTGDRCLYAWQHIGRHQDTVLPTTGSVSIRLRLCDADASEQELLSVMYGFTIVGYLPSPLWNPYGNAPKVSQSLGALSAPYEPTLPVVEAPVRKTPVRPKPAPPVKAPVVEGPIVPLPESGRYEDFALVPPPES